MILSSKISKYIKNVCIVCIVYRLKHFYKQVRMKLDNDTEKGLLLVPETYGMNVPSTFTIVIIAGKC